MTALITDLEVMSKIENLFINKIALEYYDT